MKNESIIEKKIDGVDCWVAPKNSREGKFIKSVFML